MLNVKSTLVAVTLTAFTATLAGGVMAERDGKKGGKRGGGIEQMCSSEQANKSAERKSELLGKLNLNADQMALFNAMEASRDGAKAQICAKAASGDVDRSEIRGIMKDARESNKDTRKAFKDSLTDDQKQVRKEMRKGKKGKKGKGKRGGKRHGSGSSEG